MVLRILSLLVFFTVRSLDLRCLTGGAYKLCHCRFPVVYRLVVVRLCPEERCLRVDDVRARPSPF
jgi:hypothetical protein